MSKRLEHLAAIVVTVLLAGPLAEALDQDIVKKDLTAVIALHGLPCGKVVSFERRAESDYVAVCENGNRYHIYLSAAGRVLVERQ